MIPILFAPEENEFVTNGKGRLIDCTRCIVTEERNGIYECEFDYPITGKHYNEISEGDIIYCIHDDKKTAQPFDIYARSAPLDGIVTFYAHHVSYRLGHVILKPFQASSCVQALAMMQTQTVNDNPFTFWTDKDTTGNYTISVPVSVKEMLGGTTGSILDIYGTGEYEWDGWTVKLYLHRGQDLPVQIRYGKNLSDMTYEKSILNRYSAVAPYWKGEDGDVVMLPEYIVISDEVPISEAEMIDEKRISLTDENGESLYVTQEAIEPVPLDLTERFDSKPTESQLRTQAYKALESSSDPKVNIRVEFAQLWQTPEYESYAPLQRVSLCDRISVYYPDLGVVAHKQQVVKVVYNVLMERYDSVELGEAQTSFAEALRASIESDVLKQVPSTTFLEQSVNRATNLLRGGTGGHIVIGTDADGKPNEIFAMDTDDIATAVQVIRINKNGIGFSTTGYNGPFRSAWTIDGHFVADFIDTGTLQANLLKTGILTDRLGKNYWNLDTGEFSISLEPGEEGEVTRADLNRVENNARTFANEAEQSAKSYVDDMDILTETEIDNKIAASAAGLESRFSTEYSAKGDTVVSVVPYYYKSTSPTQLFGGSWGTDPPIWEEGYYIWEKDRYYKGTGGYNETDPVCITGNTGNAIGEKGEDALTLYWTADNVLTTPKETSISATLVAHVGRGDEADIDVVGTVYDYIWYISRDNNAPEICGRGKQLSIVINEYLCENRADIWFGLNEDETMFWMVDATGTEITDHDDNALEVA